MDVTDALRILKSLKQFSPKIERISLEFMCKTYPTDRDHLMGDLLVDFTLKMKHLSCLSLSLKQLDGALIKNVHERIKKEVLPTRPSLWFHLDRCLPEASDPGVPWVHYHQIVRPMSFIMPSFWAVTLVFLNYIVSVSRKIVYQ